MKNIKQTSLSFTLYLKEGILTGAVGLMQTETTKVIKI